MSQSVNNYSSGTFPPYLQVWNLGGDKTDLFNIWVEGTQIYSLMGGDKTDLFITLCRHNRLIHYMGGENKDLFIIWVETTQIPSLWG